MAIVYEKYRWSVLPLSSEEITILHPSTKENPSKFSILLQFIVAVGFLEKGAEADIPSERNHLFADFIAISRCIIGSFSPPCEQQTPLPSQFYSPSPPLAVFAVI